MTSKVGVRSSFHGKLFVRFSTEVHPNFVCQNEGCSLMGGASCIRVISVNGPNCSYPNISSGFCLYFEIIFLFAWPSVLTFVDHFFCFEFVFHKFSCFLHYFVHWLVSELHILPLGKHHVWNVDCERGFGLAKKPTAMCWWWNKFSSGLFQGQTPKQNVEIA